MMSVQTALFGYKDVLHVYLPLSTGMTISYFCHDAKRRGSVTEILVRQKFWSGGPKFLENWSAGPLFSENFGPRMELWSERKYFGVSTFNDTRLCQSVCIVSRIPRK